MLKLTDYARMAASEYMQEVGHTELDARWIAEFFEESGVMEAYPEQNLIPFADMVQKELTKNAERANKNMLQALDRIARRPGKSSR
ncbi:MAG: hypothetical protein J0I90_07365 [Nitrosospira sp.]|jgi:hypothetical protein|nr:hypothetical protein [Nitrosospira sp.]MBN9127386.1 hypothetical protein [Nitrosospira sp.]OJY10819.1 MAG: hypothetical protein BGO99_05625 [Nitrosospira sp. 56-18]